MKFKEFVLKMFTANSGVSSKRVCGFIGWLACLGICIYCTIKSSPAPDICEMLFICSAGLLGLDSVTQIWKPTSKTQIELLNKETIKNEEQDN